MKSQIKSDKGCSREIKVEISPEELSDTFDKVYSDIRRKAKVPGFRPGHAPRDMLESLYSANAQEEMIKRAIPAFYLKAVVDNKLSPVSPPEIEDVDYKQGALYFTAKVDVRPTIKLKAYKGINLKKKKTEVTDAKVDLALQDLRKAQGKKGEEDKAGADKEELPALNDEFAKRFGVNSLAELKEIMKKNMIVNAEMETNADIERQLYEELLKKASFDIPGSLIEKNKKEIVNQIKTNQLIHGVKKEDLEAKAKEIEEQAEKESERRVRLSFIIDEVAQREKIEVSEEDLEKKLEDMSQRYGQDKGKIREYLEKNDLIEGVKDEIRTRKTVEFLLRESRIEEK